MLNFIAMILCTAGAVAQWNDDWWLVGVCAFFAIGNGYYATDWIKKKVSELNYSWKHRHDDDF